jgi:hypothetical protein
MVLNGDLNSVAELAFHDLDSRIFALFVLATCAVVGRRLYQPISIIPNGIVCR